MVPALWAVGLAACGGDSPSILDPASNDGDDVARLWWVLFAISAVVVVIVTVLLVIAALRHRRAGSEGDVDQRPVPWGDPFVIIAGIAVPGGILAGTFVFSLGVLDDLAGSSPDPDLTVEVVGHQWWWEVRYPNGAVTANEIHIPVGQRVELSLPTADVIHSFWVPELQVKKDQIPGMDNRLSLEADRPGRFHGQCAEFCGIQHANMKFQIVAQPADEFEDWLAHEAEPANDPETAEARQGEEVLLGASCAGCHTVRGGPPPGTSGRISPTWPAGRPSAPGCCP